MRIHSRPVPHLARRLRVICAFGLAAFLVACAPLARPVISHRGFVPDTDAVSSLRIGIDNKNSVATRLGSPSAATSFDGDTWYYISQTQKDFLYHRPRTLRQDVLEVKFDKKNLVAEIEHYDLKDARTVAFVSRTTPTRGKELTFLEQMFGNFGRFSTDQQSDSPRPN